MSKERRKKIIENAPSKFDEERWRTEEDLKSVARAHAVRKDPDRMKRVTTLAKEKLVESKGQKDEAEEMIGLGEGKD